MKARLIVLLALQVLSLGRVRAEDDVGLASQLDPVLNGLASSGAVLHARVIELPGRRELYARNAEVSCIPASNLKLLTSAAALDIFGVDYRAKTYLAMDGDDLWIVGTGDPGTGDPRLAKAAGGTTITMLDEWAEAIERRGIKEIRGDLVYDDGAFECDRKVHPSWEKAWLRDWYAAPTAGLNFNDNCVDITLYPTEEGKPARYELMPPVRIVRIVNECLTGKNGQASIRNIEGVNAYKLVGSCHGKTELPSKPITDPGAFFADALHVCLRSHGISVKGRIRRANQPLDGKIPPSASKVVAVHETTMRDILSRCNKNSQNLFAECLCKMAGREYEAKQGRSVPGSWENGHKALRAFLAGVGVNDKGLVPIDGSGLSPDNRANVKLLTEMLAVMHSRPDGVAYRESLSVAGVDGSLRNRMCELKGLVFGKTGYIGGVCSLSGYIKTRQGHWLAFSFIYNSCPERTDNPRDVVPFTKLQDEACKILVGWPK